MRTSSSRRGALPGRKPGIFTSFASLRNAASIACSKSSAGIATWRRTLLSSSGSTDVVSDIGLRSLLAGLAGSDTPPALRGRSAAEVAAVPARDLRGRDLEPRVPAVVEHPVARTTLVLRVEERLGHRERVVRL